MVEFFQIHLAIFSIVVPIILAWVRAKIRCVDKIDKRTFRISQAMITMAEDIDRQTNTAHEDAMSDLTSRMTRILKDEDGNL